MFYRIFVHCVSPRQYVLYLESFSKTTIFKEVESVSVYHAICRWRMRWRKHPIHYWEQTSKREAKRGRKVHSKSMCTWRFLYFHRLSRKLAKKWRVMALSKILKNRQLLRESLSLWYWTVMMLSIEKSFNALIFGVFKKSSKANIDARQNNCAFQGWRGMTYLLSH